MIMFHPLIRNPSVHLQLQQPGDENGPPPGVYGPVRRGPQPHWLISGLAGAHGRCPAAPGDDKAPSPGQKPFHACVASTIRRLNGHPPVRYHPARCSLHYRSEWYITAQNEYTSTTLLYYNMGNARLAPRAEPWPYR